MSTGYVEGKHANGEQGEPHTCFYFKQLSLMFAQVQ